MVQVLRQHGYPEKFVQAVCSLHEGTHVQFLANGSKSRKIRVTSGIRQGCPLAPLLFILALEPLYRKLDSDMHLSGVVIQSAAGQLELRVAGYADDTAVYLRSPEETTRLRELTSLFGQASGLQLNEGKTAVIALHPQGPQPGATLPPPLQYQPHGVAGRYLGIQVGSGVPPERSWEVADAQLRVRLTLASHKTTTVDQRSMIAAAVIVPKLTYIAQHAWPSLATINTFAKKLRHYVWHATFTDEIDGTRAWLDADLASLDRTCGGLAVPDLRAEIMAMAATTVERWAATGTAAHHVVGDVLFANAGAGNIPAVKITPNALPPPAQGSRVLSSMWKTGRKLLTCAGGTAFHPQRAHVVSALRSLGMYFDALKITWEGEAYRVDGTGLLGSVYRKADALLATVEGEQCLEWLPEAGLADLHLHLGADERLPCIQVVPAAPAGGTIADVVTWALERRGILWFHPTKPRWRGDSGQDSGLDEFLTVLITNFPRLLTRCFDRDEVRMVASPPDHPLTATVDSNRTLVITTSVSHSVTIMGVGGHVAVTNALVTFAEPEVTVHHVHPHPCLSRRVSIWLAGKRRPTPRRHFKQYVRNAAIARGLKAEQARAAKWTQSSAIAAEGLNRLEWRRLRRIFGLTKWGEQILYRLKNRAFSMYDVRQAKMGCPHARCVHELDVDIYHVFWTCPAARQLRDIFLRPWLRLGLHEGDIELACFSLELPAVPAGIWEAAASTSSCARAQTGLMDADITSLVDASWRLGVALYFHAVWRWRVQHFDETNDVSVEYHKLLLATRLRLGYGNMAFYVAPGPGLRRPRELCAKHCDRCGMDRTKSLGHWDLAAVTSSSLTAARVATPVLAVQGP